MSSPTESPLVKPVRLDPVTEARLSRLAEETGQKKSFYRRELIEQGMDDLEDAYFDLGAVALEAHYRSGEATIPLDEVMRNLGLAD
jgi:RHH-type rel operon transcriptional repressor/antitoxin RelB